MDENKISLYQTDGTKTWEYEKSERMLSNVKVVGDYLYVAGKEVYVLDKNGQLVQELSPTTYMSSDSYYVQTTLSQSSSNETQLIIGSMGLYSYDILK